MDEHTQLLSSLMDVAHKMNSSTKLDEILHDLALIAQQYAAGSSDFELHIAEYIATLSAQAIARDDMRNKLMQAERLKTVGLIRSSLVHDIRNMLGVVESYVELVEDDPSSAAASDYFLAIHTEIKRVQNLANDMLDYSKHNITLDYTNTDINTLCQQVADAFNVSLKDSSVSVSNQGKSGSISADVDSDRLFRAIFNIVNNAVQAVHENGRVLIRSRRLGDYAYISIADNGKGIPKRLQKVIFQPFQGFDKAKSTGLGLAIVTDIINAHKGTIRLRSVEGKYTIFTIKVPIRH